MGVWRGLAANAAVLRVLAAYTLFTLTEYTVWIAMLVYAYGRGGASTAGVVAVAQLMPAAVVAPLAASVADWRSPLVLLAGGYLTQAIAMAALAVCAALGLLAALLVARLRTTAAAALDPAAGPEPSGITPAATKATINAATTDASTEPDANAADVRTSLRLAFGQHRLRLLLALLTDAPMSCLATVRCAEPGRLLRLTSQDLQWLVDTEPAVKARLAVTLAERLKNR